MFLLPEPEDDVSPQVRDEAMVLLQKSVGSMRKDEHTGQDREKHKVLGGGRATGPTLPGQAVM